MPQFQLSALTRRTLRLRGECVRTYFYRRDAEHAETTQRRNLKLRHHRLFTDLAEEYVDPIEGDCAASDDEASRDGTPENVGTGKLPNCEQRGKDGDEDASARDPEGNASHHGGIQKTAPLSRCLRFLHTFLASILPQTVQSALLRNRDAAPIKEALAEA